MKIYPRLLALDLDQTIMSDDGKITERTISAIYKIKQKGVDVIFITGRPPRWMFEVEKIFESGKAIIANGAIFYDLEKKRILEYQNINLSDQKKIVKEIRRANLDCHFAVEKVTDFKREKGYIPRWDDGVDLYPCDDITNILDEETYKILVKSDNPNENPDEFLNQIKNAIKNLGEATYCNNGVALIEISSRGVNKGEALKGYCIENRITQNQVAAIGDSVNDFSMLEWAGHSWIMASGNKQGRKVAKMMAPNFEDDGAAQVIEQIIDNGL